MADKLNSCLIIGNVPEWMTTREKLSWLSTILRRGQLWGIIDQEREYESCGRHTLGLFQMISYRRFVDEEGLLPKRTKRVQEGLSREKRPAVTFRRAEQANLAMGWIDYKKASGMIPHPWIVECLGMFGVAENVTSLLVNSMREWITELTLNWNKKRYS